METLQHTVVLAFATVSNLDIEVLLRANLFNQEKLG